MIKKTLYPLLILILTVNNVFANRNISLIRDTEIENFLYEISYPIFVSAGLNSDDIKFYIINDNTINAFVMGGQNIFVNTGTLTSFNTPDAVLGIIAHETGHIAGGHLARYGDQLSNVKAISIGSILLGIGALLAGVPEVGQAIIFGGLQVQQQSVLGYTRSQEEMADDLATKYLNSCNLSSQALLYSMDKFYMSELQYSNEMEYYSTHPLSRNRKQFIENKISKETKNNNLFNKKYVDSFNFIKAKILAYNVNQGSKNIRIDIAENSDYMLYANSIINMNKGDTKIALRDAEYLIKKYPTNPYFYELKGDIYFKNNDVKNALKNYETANEMLKDNTLIKKMIAFIIVKYKQKNLYTEAINDLNYIIQTNPDDNGAIKLLAELYFDNGDLSLSYLNLAKYYVGRKEDTKAVKYLEIAKENTKDKNILEKIEDIKLTLK